MSRGIFIAGTDTEVGKTYVTCRLLNQLRNQGIDAVGMKPVASGTENIGGRPANTDVEMIWRASGESIPRSQINQYVYDPFIAPHLAAARQKETISLTVIDQALAGLQQNSELVIVEGAGGLMTPINGQQTFLDLAQVLDLAVILVVAVRLGCINHALLTQNALVTAGIPFLGWIANYPEKGEEDPEVVATLGIRLAPPLLGVLPWQGAVATVKDLDLGSLNEFIGIQ